MVWNSIPAQLAKENRKFFFGHIKKGARSKDYETALSWLVDAGLPIKRIYRTAKKCAPRTACRSTNISVICNHGTGVLGIEKDSIDRNGNI